ncbi:methyltransferase domain-containing protein [Acidobacteria bacterium AH-259-O06]|nr:methyltransferase domain-containing protein [Acidobacteria bacterium AH-259-O06]
MGHKSKNQHSDQDKGQEIAFFSDHASVDEYNVFSEDSNKYIVERCLELVSLKAGALVFDLGCGSGVFTQLLQECGVHSVGLDICPPLVSMGQRKYPDLPFVIGDVEFVPVRSEKLDGVLLSGLIHHLPNPSLCAREVHRVLKPGGVFAAFDPNRRNPFMWLYRDRSSPFYSSRGVTANERPIVAEQVAKVFSDAGFRVWTDCVSVHYRYIASSRLRWAIPLYNTIETLLFKPAPLKRYRAFVLTAGVKE